MGEIHFKYDVAFSFLKEDEGLAQEINSMLKTHTKTFLYSKRQKEIAGTDGEQTFNSVFGNESRVVVILYRESWGKTKWTRIEETAIKNRAFNEGYEFTLFIPLDNPPAVPNYLPRTYIWYGINTYGTKIATSIIESKIQSMGGIIKIKTPEDLAKKIKGDEKFEIERKKLLNSTAGVEKARLEARRLFNLLKSKVEKIKKDAVDFSIKFEQKDNDCYIHSYGYSLKIYWQPSYLDSLIDSYLYVALQSARRYPSNPNVINEMKYNFDISAPDVNGWVEVKDRRIFITSVELGDKVLTILLEYIEKQTETKRINKYL